MPPGIDDTNGEFAVRLRDPGDFQDGSFRRIPIKREKPRVFGIVGRPKGEETTRLQSLRFPKDDGWTRSSVREWLDAHPDTGKAVDVGAVVAERLRSGALVWERDEEDRVDAPALEGDAADLTLLLLKTAPGPDDIVYKSYRASELKAIDPAKHIVDITISTKAIDRDREIVEPGGMRTFKPKRIPLVSSHDYRQLLKHIGEIRKATPGEDGVTAQAHYFAGLGNQEADWGWQLVELGVAAYSIGFIPIKVIEADTGDEKVIAQIMAGKVPVRTYAEWELVETSHVVVPSNRGAVQHTLDAAVSKGLMSAAEEQSVLALLSPPPRPKQCAPDQHLIGEDGNTCKVCGFVPPPQIPKDVTATQFPKPGTVATPPAPVQTPAPDVLDLVGGAKPVKAAAGEIAECIIFDNDGITQLFCGTFAELRAQLTKGREPVEVVFRGTKTFDVQVEAEQAVDALEAWAETFFEKLQAAIAELRKSIPTIPADSPAFWTGEQLALAMIATAQKVADQRIDQTLGRALGIVEYHPVKTG